MFVYPRRPLHIYLFIFLLSTLPRFAVREESPGRAKHLSFFAGGWGCLCAPQGTPEIKEHYIDSKKDVDRHLKFSCEQFIQQQTQIFVGNLEEFLTRVTGAGAEAHSAPRQQQLILFWISFIPFFLFFNLSFCLKKRHDN